MEHKDVLPRFIRTGAFGAALCLGMLLAACSSGSNAVPAQAPDASSLARKAAKSVVEASNPIQHVVIIVQENRSFDNLFNGFPNANTTKTATLSTGKTVQLQGITLKSTGDPLHSHPAWWGAYDNGNMYFDLEDPDNPGAPFYYVKRSAVEPYWRMALKYGIGDNMYQSNTGPSFPAHLYLISGQGDLTAAIPFYHNHWIQDTWGCDDPPGSAVGTLGPNGTVNLPGVYPCFDDTTLGDELDSVNASWKYYAAKLGTETGIWSAYDAISHIRYGADWKNVVSPETKVLADAKNGNLPAVCWVTPGAGNSDHAPDATGGPAWVSSIVNAIGSGPQWNSTAIFITWDDWGDWFDHVPPPQLDSMGLSFRVPIVVVSPYAKPHYVSHVQHEFGSILKFVEDLYGLPPMSGSDQRADDLSDFFNYNQQPTKFEPITGAQYPMYVMPDGKPPDND